MDIVRKFFSGLKILSNWALTFFSWWNWIILVLFTIYILATNQLSALDSPIWEFRAQPFGHPWCAPQVNSMDYWLIGPHTCKMYKFSCWAFHKFVWKSLDLFLCHPLELFHRMQECLLAVAVHSNLLGFNTSVQLNLLVSFVSFNIIYCSAKLVMLSNAELSFWGQSKDLKHDMHDYWDNAKLQLLRSLYR